MIAISQNGIISFPRGETFSTPLFLNQGTDLKPIRYILKDNDEVYLSIMEPRQPFEKGIIRKIFTKDNLNKNGDVIIRIEHDDTRCLLPGKYFYQIKAKLIDENGREDVNTVVEKTELIIEE